MTWNTINNVSTTKEGGFALINQDSVLEILSGTSMSTVKATKYSIIAAYDSDIKLVDSSFQDFDNTGIYGN